MCIRDSFQHLPKAPLICFQKCKVFFSEGGCSALGPGFWWKLEQPGTCSEKSCGKSCTKIRILKGRQIQGEPPRPLYPLLRSRLSYRIVHMKFPTKSPVTIQWPGVRFRTRVHRKVNTSKATYMFTLFLTPQTFPAGFTHSFFFMENPNIQSTLDEVFDKK